ncbi:hypothetical protein [Methylobacterium platani]|uniref:Uncharacterized protein n=2 Tax=Methylobacterium platani TaxID=427683 RepID=A0A179SHH7_9HYPH|nr:hypothetical protein [Methylobacterium platani]KMO21384.1 hypothetical protein SQ03_03250 [Methylobacterium platani JCM 14648]OAS26341.1 hypothetical protein A5481_06395 [Methylobacterium platani]
MTDPATASALAQLSALARNMGLTHDELIQILTEVDEAAATEDRDVPMAERLIAARARVMSAGLR